MSDTRSPEFILQRPGQPRIRPSLLFSLILSAVALVLIALFALDSYFVVDPTEMAAVRRLGQVTTAKPLGPGLHFKLPLIDQVDRLQVSLDTFKLDKLVVNTIDNQPIAVTVGLTYRIPPQAVLPLLYEVGRAGNFDIDEQRGQILGQISEIVARIEKEYREFTAGGELRVCFEKGEVFDVNGWRQHTLEALCSSRGSYWFDR